MEAHEEEWLDAMGLLGDGPDPAEGDDGQDVPRSTKDNEAAGKDEDFDVSEELGVLDESMINGRSTKEDVTGSQGQAEDSDVSVLLLEEQGGRSSPGQAAPQEPACHSTPIPNASAVQAAPNASAKRATARRRIPGPAGRLVDGKLLGETDQEMEDARRSFSSAAWRCLLAEEGWDEGDENCDLRRWPIKRALAKDTWKVAKIVDLLVGSIAKIRWKFKDPVVVLADKEDHIEVQFPKSIADEHGDMLKAGTLLVLRNVFVNVSFEGNTAVCGHDGVTALFSREEGGFRAKFYKPKPCWKMFSACSTPRSPKPETGEAVDGTNRAPNEDAGDDADDEIGAGNEAQVLHQRSTQNDRSESRRRSQKSATGIDNKHAETDGPGGADGHLDDDGDVVPRKRRVKKKAVPEECANQ